MGAVLSTWGQLHARLRSLTNRFRLPRSKHRLRAYHHRARDRRTRVRVSLLLLPNTPALARRSRPPRSAITTPSLGAMVSHVRGMNRPRSEHRSPSSRTSSPSSNGITPRGDDTDGARWGYRRSRGIDRPRRVGALSDRGGSIRRSRGALRGAGAPVAESAMHQIQGAPHIARASAMKERTRWRN